MTDDRVTHTPAEGLAPLYLWRSADFLAEVAELNPEGWREFMAENPEVASRLRAAATLPSVSPTDEGTDALPKLADDWHLHRREGKTLAATEAVNTTFSNYAAKVAERDAAEDAYAIARLATPQPTTASADVLAAVRGLVAQLIKPDDALPEGMYDMSNWDEPRIIEAWTDYFRRILEGKVTQ